MKALASPSARVAARAAFPLLLSLLFTPVTLAGCRRPPAAEGERASAAPPARADSQAPAAPLVDEAWERTRAVFHVEVGESPARGSADALVTIVEFADFHCAPCSEVEPTLRELRAKYGEKLRLVWKNAPPSFHAGAEEAVEAALEARAEKGDDAFWNLHDRLFEHQADLAIDAAANVAAIMKLAEAAGANPANVTRAIAQHRHREAIEEDLELGEELDNKGSLEFFVNGRRLEGAPPRARFEKMIDEELDRAGKLVASGVSPRDLYATLIKDGRGARPLESKEVPRSLPTNDPSLGAPRANVTVHIWSDYQCPLCAAVERGIALLRKEHGERVRFVWHDLPLPRHPSAQLAARAAREAYAQKGPGAFWIMHDKIVGYPQPLTRSVLDGFAKEQKLDESKWRAALDGDAHAREIAADVQAAADDGITETPAYLVVPGASSRGYFIGATEESGKLQKAVERALDEATD